MRGIGVFFLALGMAFYASASARAQEPAPPSDDNPFYVDQLNPDYEVDKLNVPGVKIRKHKKPAYSSPLPPAGLRSQMVDQAGLARETASWDAYGRDTFYLDASLLTAEKFAAHYPKLDRAKLEKFHQAVQARRKADRE